MTESNPSDPATPEGQTNPDSSWTVSVCFWVTLVVAAAVYGTVALAPKFCVWNEVRLEYRQNVARLVELENHVAYLERVEAALKTDAEFRNRVAGVSDSVDNDEEFIPVSGSLLFGHDDQLDHITETPQMPGYHAMTVHLASHSELRASMLAIAACLTIFAFTFLNDAGTDFVNATGRLVRSTALIPVARYFAASSTEVREEDADAE